MCWKIRATVSRSTNWRKIRLQREQTSLPIFLDRLSAHVGGHRPKWHSGEPGRYQVLLSPVHRFSSGTDAPGCMPGTGIDNHVGLKHLR
jgi:hypothetical protein